MHSLHKLPILNSGIFEKQKDFVKLQISVLNLDALMGIIVPIIFLFCATYFKFHPYFIFTLFTWIFINALVLFLNRSNQIQFSSIFILTFYLISITSISFAFGKGTQIHLFHILSSFGCFTYYINRSWLPSILAILFSINFLIISILDFTPIIELDQNSIKAISTLSIISFSIIFSYKMLALMFYNSMKAKDEILLEKAESQKAAQQKRGDLLQLIIDKLPHYIFWKNDKGEFLGCNSLFSEKVGLISPSDIIHKVDDEIDWNDEILPFMTTDTLCTNHQETIIGREESFENNDGQVLWYSINKIPLSSIGENEKGYLYTFQDISEKKNIEIDIKESEERFKKIFDFSPYGISFMDLESENLISYNNKFEKIIGLRPEDESEIHISDITEKEDVLENEKLLAQLLNGEISSYVLEKKYKKKDGTSFWVKENQTLVDINQKEYILGFIEEIDAYKKTKIKLTQNELKYRSLFENGFDGIVIFDIDQVKIVDVNQKILDYFKVESKEEFLSNNTLTFSPEYQPNGETSQLALQKLIEKSKIEDQFEFQWMHQLKDGTEFHTSIYTFRNSSKPHLFTSIYKDITDKIKQEETIKKNLAELNLKNIELEKYIESNMQLENFAYVASHDLKGPIRTMVSFSQLLKRSALSKLDDNELEYLEFIIGATKNMQNLINDLLSYSRIESEKKVLVNINLPDLLDEILLELKVNIDEKQANIQLLNIPQYINADKTKMRQIFQNLISNALKFTQKEKANIVIEAKENNDEWLFSVKDNGIGIEKEYFNKIFLLFKKLHSNKTYEGTGIGLSLCKKVVDQHNGRIWLDSELGKGTTFHFTIEKSI